MDNENSKEDSDVDRPWVIDPEVDGDDVILGLASESVVEEDGGHAASKNAIDPYALYMYSAARGNTFTIECPRPHVP